MLFYKSEKKHVFNVFYLQIDVFIIYASDKNRSSTVIKGLQWSTHLLAYLPNKNYWLVQYGPV